MVCGWRKNIPIGNLTSQWLGNVYLHELDMFVKTQMRWRMYIRYCDDFCLFGNNSRELHLVSHKLSEFLNMELGLCFSKCVIRRTCFGLDYIGYRHFHKFVLLRRSTAKKIRRRIGNIARNNDNSEHALGQIAAARGWLKWSCSYNYCKSLIAKLRDIGCCNLILKRLEYCLIGKPSKSAYKADFYF